MPRTLRPQPRKQKPQMSRAGTCTAVRDLEQREAWQADRDRRIAVAGRRERVAEKRRRASAHSA